MQSIYLCILFQANGNYEDVNSENLLKKNNSRKYQDNTSTSVSINRPAFDQANFDIHYKRKDCSPTAVEKLRKQCKKTCNLCCKKSVKRKLLECFPVLNLLRTYRWKNWILSDVIAGLCVGSIHIPQCMGFALLSSLPPVYGLYSTLFPILLYFIFGTSRHISVGTMAVVSIMIGSVVNSEVDKLQAEQSQSHVTTSTISSFNEDILYTPINDNYTFTNGSQIMFIEHHDNLVQFKVGIAISVTFFVGIIQVLMSVLKLDIVATFMSMPFSNGFMVGATCHIITSQVPFCLGFKIPPQPGIATLLRSWIWIFKGIAQTNIQALIISLLSMVFLFLCKEILNQKFKKHLKIPIPAELILIVIGTLSSYFVNLKDRYNVRIIGHVPSGFPPPKLPTFHNSQDYIVDSFIIAVVSYSVCMSMAKIFSEKYHYEIDSNQELLAIGIVHTVTSFFNGFAGSQAPPRTVVHDSTGGKTQMASLVAAILVFLVILFLGPLFEALPNCILASIIIIALIPLIKKFQELPQYWRVNRNDFLIWTVTFLSVVFLSIDMGLWIGLITSLLTIALKHNHTAGELLGKAGDTEIYVARSQYQEVHSSSNEMVFVFKYESPVYFVNVDKFKKELMSKTIDPEILRGIEYHCKNITVDEASSDTSHAEENNQAPINNNEGQHITRSKRSLLLSHKQYDHLFDHERPGSPKSMIEMQDLTEHDQPKTERNGIIIVDCSAISYIDIMGLNCFKFLISTYKEVNVDLMFTNCSSTLLDKMKHQGIDLNTNVYPTIVDAMTLVYSC